MAGSLKRNTYNSENNDDFFVMLPYLCKVFTESGAFSSTLYFQSTSTFLSIGTLIQKKKPMAIRIFNYLYQGLGKDVDIVMLLDNKTP